MEQKSDNPCFSGPARTLGGQSPAINNRLSVKIPLLGKNKPHLWFIQIEA